MHNNVLRNNYNTTQESVYSEGKIERANVFKDRSVDKD
jgi:hypothetical protein